MPGIWKAAARFVLGLTATPYRRDGLGELITMRCGPVRRRFEGNTDADPMERGLVVRETGFDPALGVDAPIQEVYRELVQDEDRNRWICAVVREAVADGKSCLALTEWRDRLEHLAEILRSSEVPMVELHGRVKKTERLSRVGGLNNASPENPVLVLATGPLVGEGFDLPRLDTLVLAFPISFRGKVIQYVGRILRSHPTKHAVTVYDYRDGLVPVLARMQGRRQRTLEGIGFRTEGRRGSPPEEPRGEGGA